MRHTCRLRSPLFRCWLIIACALLMLSGCKSSRPVVKRGSEGKWEQAPSRPLPDYSREPSDPMGRDLVEEARRWMGTPYRYGGQDRDGTDCSGLVMQVYRQVCEVKLPRTTTDQRIYCMAVPRDKTRVGDLVFFSGRGGKGSVSHVGLYIGNGEMIHASSSRGVTVSPVDTGYWGERLQGVGRVGGAPESYASLKRNRKTPASAGASELMAEVPSTPAPVVPPPPVVPRGVPSVTAANIASATASDSATAEPDSAAVSSGSALDILDQLINEKVDSIFSSSFLD